jgi:hypothetical protein
MSDGQPVDHDIAETHFADREKADGDGAQRDRDERQRAKGDGADRQGIQIVWTARGHYSISRQAGTAFQKYRTNPRFSSRSFTRNTILTFVPESICPCSTSVMSAMKRPPSLKVIMP